MGGTISMKKLDIIKLTPEQKKYLHQVEEFYSGGFGGQMLRQKLKESK